MALDADILESNIYETLKTELAKFFGEETEVNKFSGVKEGQEPPEAVKRRNELAEAISSAVAQEIVPYIVDNLDVTGITEVAGGAGSAATGTESTLKVE